MTNLRSGDCEHATDFEGDGALPVRITCFALRIASVGPMHGSDAGQWGTELIDDREHYGGSSLGGASDPIRGIATAAGAGHCRHGKQAQDVDRSAWGTRAVSALFGVCHVEIEFAEG